jgi:hypothetical protein
MKMGLMDTLKGKINETGLTEELCNHLNGCGLKAKVVDRKGPEALHHSTTMGMGWVPLGCVRLEGCNIDYVEMYRYIEHKRSGFSVGVGPINLGTPSDAFAYEYTATSRFDVGESEKDLRAEIDYVTKGLVKKEIVDFHWKGGTLAEKLNQDAQLKTMLQAIGMPWIQVSASKKDGYVEITQGHDRAGMFDLSVGKYDFPNSQVMSIYDRIFGIVRKMRPAPP